MELKLQCPKERIEELVRTVNPFVFDDLRKCELESERYALTSSRQLEQAGQFVYSDNIIWLVDCAHPDYDAEKTANAQLLRELGRWDFSHKNDWHEILHNLRGHVMGCSDCMPWYESFLDNQTKNILDSEGLDENDREHMCKILRITPPVLVTKGKSYAEIKRAVDRNHLQLANVLGLC